MNRERELYNKIKLFNTNTQIIEIPIVENKDKNISTTLDTSGRFANHFIRNMASHI